MSKVSCEECGAKISSRAWLCPRCGCPISGGISPGGHSHSPVENQPREKCNGSTLRDEILEVSLAERKDDGADEIPEVGDVAPEDDVPATASTKLNLGEAATRRLAFDSIIAECVSFGMSLGSLAFFFSSGHAPVGVQLKAMTLGAGLGAIGAFYAGKFIAAYIFFSAALLMQVRSQGILGAVDWLRSRKFREILVDARSGKSAAEGPGLQYDDLVVDHEVSTTEVTVANHPISSASLGISELLELKNGHLDSLESVLIQQVKCEQLAGESILHVLWNSRGCGCFLAIWIAAYGLMSLASVNDPLADVSMLVFGALYSIVSFANARFARRSWLRQAQAAKEKVSLLKREISEVNRVLAQMERTTGDSCDTSG